MARKVIGIDFGTSTIKIYKNHDGLLLNEQNIMAIYQKDKILAVGDEAFALYEKAPEDILVTYPIVDGVISDIHHMEMMMEYLLEELRERVGSLKGADYYLAVPTNITQVEKRAYYDLIVNARLKSRKIYLINKPVANIAGISKEVLEQQGTMVVDMGANTTEISVLSKGGLVVSKLLPVGGSKLDEAILQMIKKDYTTVIGAKTAETIKKELTSAVGRPDKNSIEVFGRSLETGLPVSIQVDAKKVNRTVSVFFQFIVEAIQLILERTPPEIAGEVRKNGVYVTGGSAQLKDFEECLMKSELPIHMCDNPESTVIKGLGNIIEHPKDFEGDWLWEEKRR